MLRATETHVCPPSHGTNAPRRCSSREFRAVGVTRFPSMTHAQSLFVAEWLLRFVMAVIIIQRRRLPSATLAWLVVVAFVPLIGAILYFLIGENRLGRKRSRRHERVTEQVRFTENLRGRYQEILHPTLHQDYRLIADLADSVGAGGVLGGNHLTILSQTDQMIENLVSDIDAAQHHCHLLYYIFNDDSAGEAVAGALIRASQRNVACRLLVDAVGSKDFLRGEQRGKLQQAGVNVEAALPVNPIRAAVARLDLRNHRKLTVIDGRVAYVGSHNVSEPIYPRKARCGAWVDATVRLTGPGVYLLQDVFLQDWYFTTGELPTGQDVLPIDQDLSEASIPLQVLPSGPESPESPLHDVILQAIRIARQQVVMTTPYFVPDDAILAAMRSAAMRGVEVLLIVPEYSDHILAQAAGRSHYGYLMDVGVQVHEFTAGLLHAKTLTVDRDFALIGSANLDVRSFTLDFELALLVYDTDFASQLRFLQSSYLEESTRLTKEEWRRRGKLRAFGDNVAKLLTPLL